MNTSPPPRLHAADLIGLATAHVAAPCDVCAPLACPGWESMPSSFDRAALRLVGTLRDADLQAAGEEPTFAEHHPSGTHAWSADAPIAPAFFPYNRCDVWVCVVCARPFLRYTEYGGYYEDERIRALDAALVVSPAP